ncbi:hypothetical protein BSZ39_09765 [Bowdeniella nasicola]|uniref:Uncharacterized protein n=1 Tax=Bowdeniella nasicola TaxID=208480 RepID=A0A1Q5Q0L1_9ACTO|nr:hypothetical protein [Bowdeniella nasicola]OKL53394.1 hypothetical protein BSZ39_09765 [Bowdeniella nasicola]
MSLGSRTATRRLAWRDMRTAPARTLITILSVTVATAAIGVLTLITLASNNPTTRANVPKGAAATMFYSGYPLQQSPDGQSSQGRGNEAVAPLSVGLAKVSERFDVALSYTVPATVVPDGTDPQSEKERRAQASIEVNDWQRVGTLKPAVGREPRAPGEAVLTQAVLDRLCIGIGDRVVIIPLLSERGGPDIPVDALKPVPL